jgi:hypothetical protein
VAFVLTVLVIAVVIGYARGGRLRRVADADLRRTWLLFVGVAVQLGVDAAAARDWLPDAGRSGWSLLLLSQLLVVGFVASNRRLPGMWLIACGLVANAVVIAANNAMPVDPAAIRAIGLEGAEVPPGKHTLMTGSTRLPWLADIVPVPPLRSIISVGDVAIAAGLLPLAHALMTTPSPRTRSTEHRPGHDT